MKSKKYNKTKKKQKEQVKQEEHKKQQEQCKRQNMQNVIGFFMCLARQPVRWL